MSSPKNLYYISSQNGQIDWMRRLRRLRVHGAQIFSLGGLFFIRQLILKCILKISGLGSLEVAQMIWDGRQTQVGIERLCL